MSLYKYAVRKAATDQCYFIAAAEKLSDDYLTAQAHAHFGESCPVKIERSEPC